MAKVKGIPLTDKKSAGHLATRGLIAQVYGGYRVQEECPIVVGHDVPPLYLDFVVHELKLAFEVQGRQHFEYVPHFHKTPQGFEESKLRDAAKSQALLNAGFTLVVLHADEVQNFARGKFLRHVAQVQRKARKSK